MKKYHIKSDCKLTGSTFCGCFFVQGEESEAEAKTENHMIFNKNPGLMIHQTGIHFYDLYLSNTGFYSCFRKQIDYLKATMVLAIVMVVMRRPLMTAGVQMLPVFL